MPLEGPPCIGEPRGIGPLKGGICPGGPGGPAYPPTPAGIPPCLVLLEDLKPTDLATI